MMEEALVTIPHMHNADCVNHVKRVLYALKGVEVVSADAPTRLVHLRYLPEQAPMRQIKIVLAQAHYPIDNEQPIL